MKLKFPPYLIFVREIRGGRVEQSFLVLKGSKFLKKLSRFVGGEYYKIITSLFLPTLSARENSGSTRQQLNL